MTASEIGRELKAHELREQQIVVIAPPDRDFVITMWVAELGHDLVVFYSGKLKMHVINLVRDDGALTDDQGRVVHVFEYLGEP